MPKIAIVFLLSYAGAIVASFLVDVSWGIYLYEINYFINLRTRWWFGSIPQVRYTFILAVVIVLSYILTKNKYSENKILDLPQTKWFVMNLILFSLISFWAVFPEMHSRTLKNYFQLLIFLYITFKVIDTPVKFERIIWSFLIGCFYIGWLGHLKGRSFGGRMEIAGPADTGGDGNAVAAVLASAIPILLFYIIKGKKWQKVISLLFFAYIMDSIVLINSRGSFLGLIVGSLYLLMYYVFLNKKSSMKQKIRIIFGVLVGVCLFVYLTDATFWERQRTIDERMDVGKKGGGRTYAWLKAVELVQQHPLGVGTWGFQYLSPQFMPEAMLSGGRRAVHSLYFQCLAERGYIGFIIFMSLVFSNFRLMRKTKRTILLNGELTLYYQGIALESSFIVFLTASAFINRLHAEILYMLMLFIGCFGNIYYIKPGKLRTKEA